MHYCWGQELLFHIWLKYVSAGYFITCPPYLSCSFQSFFTVIRFKVPSINQFNWISFLIILYIHKFEIKTFLKRRKASFSCTNHWERKSLAGISVDLSLSHASDLAFLLSHFLAFLFFFLRKILIGLWCEESMLVWRFS